GVADADGLQHAMTRAWAVRASTPSHERITWATASPTRRTGFSDDIGSWKIIATRRPRIRARSRDGRSRSETPSSMIRPVVTAPLGNSLRIVRAVTLLPKPLSPTSPTASPGPTRKETPRTTGRLPPRNTIPRFSTTNPVLSVIETSDAIGEPVADEADEEADDNDRQAGKHDGPGRGQHEAPRLGDHQAPFGGRRLHA